MTYAMEFMTYGHIAMLNLVRTIVFETLLNLFETVHGHTYSFEYLGFAFGLWTLDIITLLIILIIKI